MTSLYGCIGFSAAALLYHSLLGQKAVQDENESDEEKEVDPMEEVTGRRLDRHLTGLEHVFSVEAIRS